MNGPGEHFLKIKTTDGFGIMISKKQKYGIIVV